jgi:hypothetical protein
MKSYHLQVNGWDWKEGEMTQTLYAHMIKKKLGHFYLISSFILNLGEDM